MYTYVYILTSSSSPQTPCQALQLDTTAAPKATPRVPQTTMRRHPCSGRRRALELEG